jgi:hypothetical protein
MNTLHREIGHLKWLLSFPWGLSKDLLEEVILSLVENLVLRIKLLKESHRCGPQERCSHNCEERKEQLTVKYNLFWTIEFESDSPLRKKIHECLLESGLWGAEKKNESQNQ